VARLESGGTRWEMKLAGGACMAVTGGRKDITAGMCNTEEKAPFGEYAKVARGRVGCVGDVVACGGGGSARADWAGWARSQEKIQRKKS
jgi:hypothetical protein